MRWVLDGESDELYDSKMGVVEFTSADLNDGGGVELTETTVMLAGRESNIALVAAKNGSFTWNVPANPARSADCKYTLAIHSANAAGKSTARMPNGCSGFHAFVGFADDIYDKDTGTCTTQGDLDRKLRLRKQAVNAAVGSVVSVVVVCILLYFW